MCFECEDIDTSKRKFLAGATAAIVGAALTSQTFGQQQTVSEPKALDDPNIVHQSITFQNGADTIKGYLARPKKAGKHRAVVVSHGNPGISEDIRNAAAQMAQAGYIGLALDWNSRATGDTSKLDKPLEYYLANTFAKTMLQDTQAAIDYLKTQTFVRQKRVGLLGFCGGGWISLILAITSKDVKAVVAFYPPPIFRAPRIVPFDPRPNLIDVADKIEVPIQCHFGTQDRVIPNEDIKNFEKVLRDKKVKAEYFIYEGAGHAFYDYTRPQLYNRVATKLAHGRMLAFFKRQLA